MNLRFTMYDLRARSFWSAVAKRSGDTALVAQVFQPAVSPTFQSAAPCDVWAPRTWRKPCRLENLRYKRLALLNRKSQIVNRHAFTILEVMLAIFIFAMVLTAIYATWIAILRGSKAGLTAAAEAQRSRIAVRTVEEALLTSQMLQGESSRYSTFIADTTGDYAYLSMVSRLPASFPGVGRFGGGDLVVRRVTFEIQDGPGGKNELVMTQAPMLMATNQPGAEPYSIILATDVTEFTLEFYDPQQRDWFDEWTYTNRIPTLVKIGLGLGKKRGSSEAHNVNMRMVAIPAGTLPPGRSR